MYALIRYTDHCTLYQSLIHLSLFCKGFVLTEFALLVHSYHDLDAPEDEVSVIDYRSL
jgi:hypothetical protein